MDFPVTISDTGDQKTMYIIKTKDLSYKILDKSHGGTKYILKNVNCEARTGEITAIAGPSGAGKTSLLEILAGVIEPNEVMGHVLVNDQPMNAKSFRRISGYVSQDEALLPLLTVEETFMYSARLRLKGGYERAGCRIKELLIELGLEHVATTRIGSNGSNRGVSGGEKRRVSIGVDLVHDPSVLLIDEPTSGLDSASALHLALLLKSMAMNQGKTIVLTIHQPGFRMLEQFDQIVLLSNGIIRHRGSLNRLEERLKFEGHSIPRHVNVLEFAIDVAESLLADTKENDIENHVAAQPFQQIRSIPILGNVESSKFSYPNSQMEEIFILGQRFARNIFRTKQLFAARISQSLLAGFVLGTIFMNTMNDPGEVKLQTQIGFFAFSLTFLLSSTTEGLPIFLQERRILMRETSRGAYRVSSYVLANTFIFLPFLLIVALLYTAPVYFLVGLRREVDGFCYFSLVVWMVVLMSNSFVACFSALVPNFIMGTSLIAGIMGSFFLFSGYFISKSDIPWYWIFMHYLSLFKYPFECFMINEFGGGEKRGERCLQSVGGECVLYGDGFLMQQCLKESQKWTNLLIMLGFIVGYRVLSFCILWYRSCRPRN